MEVIFTINGKIYKVNPHQVPIETSLGSFIRKKAQLSGTKLICREGGCGACIVNVNSEHPVTKERQSWAVNSCLLPVFSCHGLDIVTVEGIGNKTKGFHAVQQRLAHLNGTQCGYCSPGMVMNMYSLLESKNGQVTMAEVENAFGGNLCRCTGYRPILDAFKSLAVDAHPALVEACQDIEDLPKICQNTGKPCQGKCGSLAKKGIHMVFESQREWHKVYNVQDVFVILEKIGSRPYMLVAGNTAHGVYRRSDDLEVFIDISSIEELKYHSLGSSALTIGANTTLTQLMQILTDAAVKNGADFSYCTELAKHVDLIANVPVRNAGTIAGNLWMKNQNNGFPSDLFLILAAVGAKLTIVEAGGKLSTVLVEDIQNLDLAKKIILNVVLPPLNTNSFEFRSFKVMPRAQSVHAYVNAAFLFEFNANRSSVVSASLCFGGINSTFVHAVNSENFVRGKNIFADDVLQNVFKTLSVEIVPEEKPGDSSAEYRKHLANSLLYRAVLDIATKHQLPFAPQYQSAAQGLHRPLSTSKQEFQTIQKNWPMNKDIPKVEGLAQTAGEAKYVEDLPNVPNELYGALVLATRPRTKILAIDPEAAMVLEGVHGFYSAKDIPGRNDFMPTELDNAQVEEIFCSGEVLYYGQPVGVILADSFELAHRAAKLVRVNYGDPDGKPILATLKRVLAADAKICIHDQPYDQEGEQYGKVEGHYKRIEGRFELPGQFHFSMESQMCICVPTEDGMDVYSSTQWVDICQIAVSQALNIPENSLNFYVRRLGGAFGAKISRASQWACACAIAAHFSQRPVRLIPSLETNMEAVGKRASCISNYQIEVNEDGRICKLLNNYLEDYGCSLNEPIEWVTAQFYKNCYDASRWKLVGKAAVTNSASNTWCRGPGTNEGITMAENIMEHIAHATGKDPLEVRLANMSEDNKIRELLPEFIRDVQYKQRKQEIDQFNEVNRWKKRGIAIVPMEYPQVFFGQMHALVSIYHIDGTVSITTAGIDMGQGVNTKVSQVAAHILGIPMSKISIKTMSSLTSPNASVSGGSMTSEAASFAVKNACEILLDRMKPVREEFPDESWEQITQRCHKRTIDLCAMYQYKAGDIQNYQVYGLSCAEVEVDVLTGNILVRRVDILEDTGESINPAIDVGQIEGAFVMGIGLYFTENLIYSDDNGQLLTNRTWNYHLPGAKDIPVDFRVKLLHNTFNKNFVLRSKTTGEPALNMTISLLFALRHALNSARKDAGLSDEWYTIVTPSTPEQICLAAGSKIEHLKLQ